MTIGTSDGHTYEDEFDYALSRARMNPVTQDMGAGATEKPSVSEANTGASNVVRDKEVPYISGLSNSGDTLYIDRDVPTKMSVSGVTFDPAEPLWIHESVEKHAMDHFIKNGMNKNKAYELAHHAYAEPAEDQWYEDHGIDVKEMNKAWKKIDQKTEQEGTENHPKDLYKGPYPHDKVEGSPHPTKDVFAEWPHPAEIHTPNFKPKKGGKQPVENMRMPGVQPNLPYQGAANTSPILGEGWEGDEETQRNVGTTALKMILNKTVDPFFNRPVNPEGMWEDEDIKK